MSINYGSNINRTFGINLPIPYVERVRVYDGYLETTVSLFFNLDFDTDVKEYLKELKELNFYIAPMIDATIPTADQFSWMSTTEDSASWMARSSLSGTIAPVDSNNRTIKAQKIIEEKESIFDFVSTFLAGTELSWYGLSALAEPFIVPSSYTSPGGEVYQADQQLLVLPDYSSDWASTAWSTQLQLTDFEKASVSVEGTQKIYKYTTTVDIRFKASPGAIEEGDVAAAAPINLYFLKALQADLSLFCFSSPLELNTEEFFDTIKPAVEEGSGVANLYKASVSPLSYQAVFQNGEAVIQSVDNYELADGSDYNDEIIQAFDGSYHTSDKITLEQIVASFGEFLGTVAEPEFQQSINNLAYILAIYGNSAELLLRLQEFRATFVDKSSATSMGRWFHKVSAIMFRSNATVMSSTSLVKTIVTNPVVIETRANAFSAYESPDFSDLSEMTDYVYINKMLIHRNGIFDSQDSYANESITSQDDYTSMDEGFFLFDFEKAVRTKSEIAKVLNVEKLENWFGKQITNEYFKLHNVVYYRYKWDPDSFHDVANPSALPEEITSLMFNHFTWFNSEQEVEYPETTSSWFGIIDPSALASFSITDSGGTETLYYPKLLLRNFNTTSDLGDYRLMCFEFSHFLESDGAYQQSDRDNDIVCASVAIIDYTKAIYTKLIAAYLSVDYDTLLPYVESAQQFCSYNNIDNHFNDFFADYMRLQYEDLETAPWIVGPLIYNFHLDLLTDVWGGDWDTIITESIKISEQISPESGTLDELEIFYDKFAALYADHYEDSGAVGVIAEGLSDEIHKTFGGDENIFFPLPDVDFMGLYGDLDVIEEKAAAATAVAAAIVKAQYYYNAMWQYFIEEANILNLSGTPDSQVETIESKAYAKFVNFLLLIREALEAGGVTYTIEGTGTLDDQDYSFTGTFEEPPEISVVTWWLEQNNMQAYGWPDTDPGLGAELVDTSGLRIIFGSIGVHGFLVDPAEGYVKYDASSYEGISEGDESTICVLKDFLEEQFNQEYSSEQSDVGDAYKIKSEDGTYLWTIC